MNAPRQGSLNPGDLGSDVFELQIGGQSIPVTAIPNVKTAEYPSLADEYRRMPSYCWIHPSNFMGVHYAWFESDEPLQAVITCPEPITRYSILPSGAAHDAIDGKRLTLSLGMHEPRYFVVQIDDYPPLVLVIDPVERDVPDREASYVFDLGTVLTDGASPADQSAALEDSFRKASKDGKIAYIPAGTYHLGPVRLHHLNRAKIYFARGTTSHSTAGTPVRTISKGWSAGTRGRTVCDWASIPSSTKATTGSRTATSAASHIAAS